MIDTLQKKRKENERLDWNMRNHEHLSKRRETNYREERSCKYSWKQVLPLSSLYFGWPLFSTTGFPLKMDIKIMIQVNYEGYKLLSKQISYDTDLEVYRYSRLSNEINFHPLKKSFWNDEISISETPLARYGRGLRGDRAQDGSPS